MKKNWFLLLISSICLEGLGRKYLASIPSMVFLLLKDVVLVWGYVVFRPPTGVNNTAKYLFRGFGPVWGFAVLWTFLQMFNPQHQSLVLAAIGFRSYWLWWIAPMVVAGVLSRVSDRRRAILSLSIMAIGIAIFAAVQFASPGDSAVNLTSVVDGEAQYASDASMLAETGRARVSSTFSFLSGFAAFTILVPTILLSLGLETSDPKVRQLALIATLLSAAVLPMSGSRSSIILGGGVLALTCWSAGLFTTVVGRRIIIAGVAGIILATAAFPDAFLGVEKRFETEETNERISQAFTVIPPVALAVFDYPMTGIGTGMQHNSRIALKVVDTEYSSEIETHRYLVELGPVGYLAMWAAKLGLMIALLRAYKILQKARRRAPAGVALAYAGVTFFGHLTFDHVWQALYFIGCGFILAETHAVLEAQAIARRTAMSAAEAEAMAPRLRPAAGAVFSSSR
jgi:hypothetical protein